MTDRPIPFRAPMVRAILDGRKTQHRIALNPQPFTNGICYDASVGEIICHCDELPPATLMMRKGKGRYSYTASILEDGPEGMSGYFIGDRLWVRENFARVPVTAYRMSDGVEQAVDPNDRDYAAIYAVGWERSKPRWRPSIYMPRWASRLTLIVKSVKVDRLQEISEEDAIADGVRLTRDERGEIPGVFVGREGPKNLVAVWPSAVEAFGDVWESIYGVGSWKKNPWVAAITFRAIHANIDSEEAKAASAS